MITETMNGLILAKQRVKNCVQYEPSKDEHSYMTKFMLYPNKKLNEDANKSRKFIADLYETDDCDIDKIMMPNDF